MNIDDFPFNELLEEESKDHKDQRVFLLERIIMLMYMESRRQSKIEQVMEAYQAAGELEGCELIEDTDIKKGCKVIFNVDDLKYWIITVKDHEVRSKSVINRRVYQKRPR